MGSLGFQGVIRRRWRLIVVGFICTAALAVTAALVITPSHRVTSSVLLLPPPAYVPPAANTDEPGNPLLALGGLDPAASVLITRMSASRLQDDVIGSTGGELEVARQVASSAPLLVVAATGPDHRSAIAIRDRAMERLPQVLRELQAEAGTPERTQIRSVEVISEDTSTRVWGDWARGVVVALAFGIALTLASAALVDGVLGSMHRSRSASVLRETKGRSRERFVPRDPAPRQVRSKSKSA